MSGVEIRVRANAKQAQQEIRRTGQSLKGLQQQAASITKTFQRMALGLGAVFAAKGITGGINRAADAMTSLNNRVKLVTKDAEKTSATVKALFDVAARSGGSIDAAAETFNRFGLALRDSNKPVQELLTVTEAVQKAAVISGSGAESAKAAIVQLGQGLASGQLRGQELNSVLEQMPRLAQAIAEGMKIPFGSLREEAMAGRVTADAVYDALLAGAEKINDEFATLQFTTGEFATVMANELTRAISEFDKVAGFSDAFKNKILLLTGAFRFVGENIAKWGLQTKLVFLIVESQAKDFFKGFTDLFRVDFDSEAVAKSIIESINSAISTVKGYVFEKVNLALEFSIPKYDLINNMFPGGTSEILGTLKTFAGNVWGIFYNLWKEIVGNSLYTGIYDPSHEYQGAAAIGNVSALELQLNKASSAFSNWADGIIGYFEDLHFEVTDAWQLMMSDIETMGPEAAVKKNVTDPLVEAFKTSFTSIRKGWDALSSYVSARAIGGTTFDEFGDTVDIANPISEAFGGAIDEMAVRWNDFSMNTFANTGYDIPLTSELKEMFNDSMAAILRSWNFTIGVIKGSPIGVAAQVAIDFTKENALEIQKAIERFFKENENLFAIAFTGGMALAFKRGLRVVAWKTILVSSIVSGLGLLGTNTKFQDSVYNAAVAWGETFKDMITGNGDVLAKVGEGLSAVFSSIGTGFIDGVFGTEFESVFADNLATALAAALTAAILLPAATGAFLKFGLGMVSRIFASSMVASAATTAAGFFGDLLLKTGKQGRLYTATSQLGLQISRMTFASTGKGVHASTNISEMITKTSKSKAVASAAAVLGGRIIAGLGLAYMSTEIGNAIKTAFGFDTVDVSYDEFGDEIKTSSLGNTFFTIINDAIAGAILGFTVGGPWLAVAAALGNVLLGIFMSEEQKNGIINMFNVVPDIVYNALADAWNRFVALAAEWTPDWVKGVISFLGDNTAAGTREGTSSVNSDTGAILLKRGDEIDERKARSLKAAGVPFEYYSGGGKVRGPGTSTSDDIPAMLSNGEYVIKASAVDKLGVNALHLLNQGIIPKFSGGGLAGRATQEIKDSFSRGDTKLAMEMISVLQQLGKLDESMMDLTEEMRDQVKKAVKDKADEDRDNAILDLSKRFNQSLADSISQVLHTGDWKGVMHGLLDTVTSSIINNFAQGLADGITKDIDFDGMFEGLSSLFKSASSVGSGSGLGSIFSAVGGFFGFSQGGIVPNTITSQAGKDSVPAMLTPGEVVLSKNDVRNMGNSGSKQDSVFNINITGDVSRQTRQEIVRMMPQIAGGVNAQNKESNFKRS
jgi:tape measure domain-containing protein